MEDNDKKIKGKWDATTPIDLLFDQIKDAQDYTSAAGQPYTATQLLTAAYNLIYATGLLFDDCKEWNRHPPHLKTTDNFKLLFKQVQHELHDQHHTAMQAGFQANRLCCNPTQQQETPLQEIAEAIANLATATASDRQALQNLTNTVKELSSQIKVKDKEIEELIKAMRNSSTPTTSNCSSHWEKRDCGSYCHTHGYLVSPKHNSETCCQPGPNHNKQATHETPMGGNLEGKPKHYISILP